MDSTIVVNKFIAYVEREPALWDKTDELCGNSNAQIASWEYIAIKLNESCEETYVTGISLAKLWSSLLTIHEDYCRNPKGVNFDYADKMKFIGEPEKEKCNPLKMKRKRAFFKHLACNLFLVFVLVLMVGNRTFMTPDVDCMDYHHALLVFWCITTALASLIAFVTTLKDIQFRRNVLPIFIIICYVVVLIVNASINGNMKNHYHRRGCSDEYFACTTLGVGFPLATLLSLGYHFIKISKKSALVSSLKTISAAYFGSALLFFCFIAGIKWNVSFFLFVVWMIMNAKFSIDAICFSWKSANIDPKNSYSVAWNASIDQFDIILNGTKQITTIDIVVVPKFERTDKCESY